MSPPPLAVSTYLSITTSFDNAETACSSLQGTFLSLVGSSSNTFNIQVCQFSDGSSIGASTLAAGPQDPSNEVLTNILLSN